MKLELRAPEREDMQQIRELIAHDYGRLAVELYNVNGLTMKFIEPAEDADNTVVADYHSGEVYAICSSEPWKATDAAPYTRGGIDAAAQLAATGIYDTMQGIHTLAAYSYAPDSPLDTTFIDLLSPSYSYRAAVAGRDLAKQTLMRRHGFHYNGNHSQHSTFGNMRLLTRRGRYDFSRSDDY